MNQNRTESRKHYHFCTLVHDKCHFSCLFRNIKKQFNSNLTSFHQQKAENHELVHQMPKSLYLSVFHNINAMPKYVILRIKNRKIQNQKLKNLGERSVRVPNRVKRGCARQDTTTPHTEKTPHYKYNVTFAVVFAVLSVFSLPFVTSFIKSSRKAKTPLHTQIYKYG